MSSNTCKIPETTGKQPSKEGELKCYKCGQKGHMQPQCPKLRSWCIAAARKDNLEEIIETIKENLKGDTKGDVSEEEEGNLNESSDEDKEMYSWDKIKYKLNYVQFISNKTVTEQQMWVVSAMIDKLKEPVYNHRTRVRERSWPLQKCNDNLLSCWDPHPIAETLSNPRSIPYCSPDTILTILRDSDTMLTMPLNSNQPLRPPMHYHHSPRTLNDLWEPQSHFCLHHSVLVPLHSNLVFTSPSQFSSFHFQYITLFQYSCSLVLSPALPSYISASLLLNSCNPL